DWVAHSFLFDSQFARAAFLFNSVFFPLGNFCIAAVIVRNYIKVKEPDQRRRMKWLTCATVIGVLPLVLIQLMRLVASVTGATSIVNGTPYAILSASQTPGLMLIYTGIAYTILKHRMFDINIVIRRAEIRARQERPASHTRAASVRSGLRCCF